MHIDIASNHGLLAMALQRHKLRHYDAVIVHVMEMVLLNVFRECWCRMVTVYLLRANGYSLVFNARSVIEHFESAIVPVSCVMCICNEFTV